MNTLKLRSLLFSIIFFSGILHCLSGTRLISGDLGQCLSEGTIEVSLNWENTIYEKSGLLIDFLSIAERDPDWETKSLKYFIQQTNVQTGKYGVRLSEKDPDNPTRLSLVIHVSKIDDDGDIEGVIKLTDLKTGEARAFVAFSSDEADNDDKIAFRDQLENIGENFGKLFHKHLRKEYKKK